MAQSQWWYASESFTEGFSRLQATTVAGSGERSFLGAQKCRVIVEGAWVRDDMDGLFKGENDIIVSTRFRAGNNPPVSKVHILEGNVQEKRWIPVAFHPEVFATRDFDPEMTELALEVRVYDEDGLDDDELAVLTSAMGGAAASAAVAFPALAPYAAFASGAGQALVKLVDTLDEHDKIVKGTVLLGVNKPANSGYDLFQPGFFICFARDVDASNLVLGDNRQVLTRVGSGPSTRYEHTSYIVLRVTRDGPSSPDMILNQKMATLLSEMELGRKGKSTQALKELTATFQAYTTMRRIQRYKELSSRVGSLTEEEKELLNELSRDTSIIPFLGLKPPES